MEQAVDEYADGCRIQKGANWYPFLSGQGTGGGVWGVGGTSGVSTPKNIHAFQKKTPPALIVLKWPRNCLPVFTDVS
jgi:hypothetical protein